MNVLPLAIPGVSESLAAYFFDRASRPVIRGSTQWNGVWQSTAAHYGDALAWALVAFLLLSLGVVAGCCITVLRSRPPGPTREQLLIDEVLRNEDQLASGSVVSQPGNVPWERPADWWKKAEE